MFSSIVELEWNLSFTVDVTPTSLRIFIVSSFKFSLANPKIENSFDGTSIDASCLFSLKFILRSGSTK
jgi:hypothetical protein